MVADRKETQVAASHRPDHKLKTELSPESDDALACE
jgi:hypothetical protein